MSLIYVFYCTLIELWLPSWYSISETRAAINQRENTNNFQCTLSRMGEVLIEKKKKIEILISNLTHLPSMSRVAKTIYLLEERLGYTTVWVALSLFQTGSRGNLDKMSSKPVSAILGFHASPK